MTGIEWLFYVFVGIVFGILAIPWISAICERYFSWCEAILARRRFRRYENAMKRQRD